MWSGTFSGGWLPLSEPYRRSIYLIEDRSLVEAPNSPPTVSLNVGCQNLQVANGVEAAAAISLLYARSRFCGSAS